MESPTARNHGVPGRGGPPATGIGTLVPSAGRAWEEVDDDVPPVDGGAVSEPQADTAATVNASAATVHAGATAARGRGGERRARAHAHARAPARTQARTQARAQERRDTHSDATRPFAAPP